MMKQITIRTGFNISLQLEKEIEKPELKAENVLATNSQSIRNLVSVIQGLD